MPLAVPRQSSAPSMSANRFSNISTVGFLKREYTKALEVLERVCMVDPEDVQMHYMNMLCYRGLGKKAESEREATLFRRFKAEESSQAITAKRRMLSPEDNNERQLIHDHTGVDLGTQKGKSPVVQFPIPTASNGGSQ